LVEASGATLNQAALGARLSAVVAMDNGSISRRIIELASTDARAIFRKAPGVSPISCLVGVLDIRGGIGTLSPLRVRSADGTITGRGSFDIYRHQIDITIASEARTTSLFALDVPVRVNGSFAAPTIRPATLSPAGRAQLAAGDDVSRLLPSLQPFARRSPCLSARAG
jgi:AsmA family protein